MVTTTGEIGLSLPDETMKRLQHWMQRHGRRDERAAILLLLAKALIDDEINGGK